MLRADARLGRFDFASAALLFVLLFVPETKGRTLEELESDLMLPVKANQ